MKNKNLKKLIVKEFGSKSAQEMYNKMAEEDLWESEEKIIEKYFKKKGEVLDVGCGTGRTTMPLKKKGYDVIGIDITPAMIKNAKKITKKKKLDIDYRVMDACNMKFKNKSFDYALFSNSGWTQTPGKKNRLKALKEVRRVLKNRGIFIFITHNRGWTGKYFFFWLKQWIKFYILKPFGFKTDEEDFGDRFFERSSSGLNYSSKQYIHIPKIEEVKREIKKAELQILEVRKTSEISGKDRGNSVVYVCKK